MNAPESEWTDLARDLGLEHCDLKPLEALKVAALDMHGLEPGEEDQLPPEDRSKIQNLERALKMLESLGALSRLAAAGANAGWRSKLLRGEYRGHRVSIHSLEGQESKYGVSLRFSRRLGWGLRIVREGMGHKLGKLLRMTQDLQVDDPTLDPLVLIQADDVESAKDWLTDPGLREDLRDLFQLSEGVEVLDWGLRFQADSGGLTPGRVRSLLDAMLPITAHVR
jgi:hypothetical protein